MYTSKLKAHDDTTKFPS